MRESKLSHISKKGDPQMVDVSEKISTVRIAEAKAVVVFPESLDIESVGELKTKKGPVVHTAIIAGTQGAKRTSELIPMCHPIPLEDIKIEVDLISENKLEIRCLVKTDSKTGVEMEALTGASITALTIYDMCKSLSHGIRIEEVRLLKKSGGKSDYSANP
jgi:cyclic pyranopterin monophosphate synthase